MIFANCDRCRKDTGEPVCMDWERTIRDYIYNGNAVVCGAARVVLPLKNGDQPRRFTTADLCPNCLKDLDNFMQEKKETGD